MTKMPFKSTMNIWLHYLVTLAQHLHSILYHQQLTVYHTLRMTTMILKLQKNPYLEFQQWLSYSTKLNGAQGMIQYCHLHSHWWVECILGSLESPLSFSRLTQPSQEICFLHNSLCGEHLCPIVCRTLILVLIQYPFLVESSSLIHPMIVGDAHGSVMWTSLNWLAVAFLPAKKNTYCSLYSHAAEQPMLGQRWRWSDGVSFSYGPHIGN